MQYGQRKLQRSVTEMRRSRSGRARVSVMGRARGALMGRRVYRRVPKVRINAIRRQPRRPAWSGRTLVGMPPYEFTHLDPLGRARMVDVTPKEATHRRAVARCRVHMKTETTSMIASGAI